MVQSSRPDNGRPDPDALLAAFRRETSGRMKVFLGAAPGVGKTYAMLQGARRLKEEGVDVVIGLVETHGRAETSALVEGLEVLPRRVTEYRGRAIAEFDLDAALARRPKLIVVDELAHTNAPESRHPKRWQDVQELLAAGIDVWTALNIQHLESLADVVSRISGVVVRETVPDRVLQEATDVVLVDITPEELIQRLNEGKVYVPETARRATQNFFTPGNLTALRELALRRTADRVDDQMVDYLRAKAIEGPWAASERLLACVGADEVSERVVRRAAQLATSFNAAWTAVTIEPLGRSDDARKEARIAKTFSLAERLGADTTRLQGNDYTAEILRLARRENVTQIVLGQSHAGLWARLLGRSLPDELLRHAGPIEIHVVPHEEARRRLFSWPAWKLDPKGLGVETAAALFAVAVAVAVGAGLTEVIRLPNLSMLFLAAVLFSGFRFGTRAAVIASFASFAAYNFFFIPPLYTFTVAQPQELFALLIFLAVAVLTGSLTGRVRDQRESVIKSAEVTQSLYDFSRKLSGASSADDVLWAAAAHMHATFGGRAVLLVAEGDDLQIRAAWPPDVQLDAAAMSAARWAYQKKEPAGWATGTLPSIGFQFRPLVAARGPIAVCGFEHHAGDEAISAEHERALTAILDQTAIALDRALLAREAVKAASMEENEKVRDALLASLSHDLRTPLSTIAGAATSLRTLGDRMSAAERLELLASIEEETARLSRFVANLLDMSRIEAGGLKVNRDLIDVADAVQGAADRSRKAFPRQPVRVSLAPDLPFVRGDGKLLEQVLFNLLDNAHKYAADSGATIHARKEGDEVVLTVTDEGPGVKSTDLDRIFEKFYRGGRADGRKPGTGLATLDLPRPDRGDGRNDRGAKSGGQASRDPPRHPTARRPGEARRVGRRAMKGPRILVVDDEPQIQRFLSVALNAAGYEVMTADSGARALRLAATGAPDLVVLDLGLPDRDGKDVLREIRQFSTAPVIILSARDRETEKIEALDLGADDYVEKPFGIGELTARLRAALRHRASQAQPPQRVEIDGVAMDFDKRLVTRDGAPIKLTPKEYDLLAILFRNAGRVVTHRQILSSVWGRAHSEDTQYLRVFIGQLRAKIERDPTTPRIVTTEPGVGYRAAEA